MKVSKTQVSNSQKEYQSHRKPKRRNWRAKREILSHFLTSIVAKNQKIEGGPFGDFFRKVSQCRKN